MRDIKRVLFALLMAFSSISAQPASAQTPPQPVWVEAVGTAIGSDFDPPVEVIGRAKADAQRKAVETAVGTFVKSTRLVSDRQFASEEMYARIRGRIDRLTVLSTDRDESDANTYHVRIKALVSPVTSEAEADIAVKATVSKSELLEGDATSVVYQSSADGYVYIFCIATDNSVTLLFPDQSHTDNHVQAGAGYVFPPEGSGMRLSAARIPNAGDGPAIERIRVIVTKNREQLLEKSFGDGSLLRTARDTGSSGDLTRRLAQIDPTEWGDTVATFVVRPR
ncbi:DUF4384 domain-containing protein [Geomonas sp.]|uniref:DUF4384 domain-containing protein n=1 Tax=Geomonas sp. TaxID=2651584 RepID=UPI002B4A14B3|nr:DUF4384 domain-containing protein [Geomonas sp.]HJV34133.1 DUF4384 domain-containing protein [Geomonas sp.]